MNKRYLLLFGIIAAPFCGHGQNLARFGDIKPGMKNEKLEQEAVRIANKKGDDYCWRETYYRAVIISYRWEQELDDNGYLKGRKIHMELLGKLPNGKCVMTDFVFRQKVLPNETFSDKLLYDRVSDLVYVDCE